jgi:hypothetical protein
MSSSSYPDGPADHRTRKYCAGKLLSKKGYAAIIALEYNLRLKP